MLQFRSLGGLQHRSLRDSVSPVLSVVRNYWREVVQEYRQADGSVTYEDPEKTHSRLRRASNAEGMILRGFFKLYSIHIAFSPESYISSQCFFQLLLSK